MRQIFIASQLKNIHKACRQIDSAAAPGLNIALKRLNIISFYDKHGASAAKEAFGVSRAAIFLWKKTFRQSGQKLKSLVPCSKAPLRLRRGAVNPLVIDFIKDYRLAHHGIGQDAIKPALDIYCLQNNLKTVSRCTIARIIKKLKQNGMLKTRVSLYAARGNVWARKTKRKRKLRRKHYKPQRPGDLVQLDSLKVFSGGIKRYVISAVDIKSRFGFAYGYSSLTSANGKDFMEKLRKAAPFEIKKIQTDNGGEFAKHFAGYISSKNITHYHNYPRHPQSNGCVERFNRTLREQHINHDENESMQGFNDGLMEYLVWYNCEKPHTGIGFRKPMDYVIEEKMKAETWRKEEVLKKSNMYRYLTDP